jgi:ABC-type multidrug transport system fused ATPase/permease subunit
MAKDTAIINGASTESVSPSLEGTLAFLIGLIIGFYLSWEMSCVMLCVSPIMVVGSALEMKAMKGGMSEEDEELWKESNLMCGDAIVNFRTVQSFANEDFLYEKYRTLLEPIHNKMSKKYFCSAFGYGMSQLGQFISFGLMFWLAGWIIKNGYDPKTGTFDKKPDDVFLALFAIM